TTGHPRPRRPGRPVTAAEPSPRAQQAAPPGPSTRQLQEVARIADGPRRTRTPLPAPTHECAERRGRDSPPASTPPRPAPSCLSPLRPRPPAPRRRPERALQPPLAPPPAQAARSRTQSDRDTRTPPPTHLAAASRELRL